jgi:hypothetical protein
MYATAHYSVREAGVFLPPACTVYGKSSVQNEEEMLDTVHADPSTNIHWIPYETGLSDTLREEHLYCLQVQFVQGLQSGDNNLCLHFCLSYPKL